MKLHEYWLGLHPLDWEFCFMPVQTYKNFITEQYHKNPAFTIYQRVLLRRYWHTLTPFYLRPWRIGIRPRTMLPCVAPQ